MNKYEACKILGINGDINPSIVKKAYRSACAKYHPDKNPGGLEMMKSVNLAYEALKNLSENIEIDEKAQGYGDDRINVINALSDTALNLELCGSWLWISGDTKEYKEILKSLSCRWAPKKGKWYFRPADYKSRGRGKLSMDDIREKHGSQSVRGQGKAKIKAA
jgi:curved DNA-binding protein CbpA